MPQNNQHEQHFITAYFARFSRSIATVEVKYDWFNYIMHFYARKWTLAIFFHLWFWQVSLKLTVARHPELHLTEVWITMSTSVHCNVSSGSWALIKIISIFNKHNHSSASGVSHGSRIPHVLDSPSQVISALWRVQSYNIVAGETTETARSQRLYRNQTKRTTFFWLFICVGTCRHIWANMVHARSIAALPCSFCYTSN